MDPETNETVNSGSESEEVAEEEVGTEESTEQGEELAGGEEEPASQESAPAPQFLTREDGEGMFSGFRDHFTGQMDNVGQQIRQLQQMLYQQRPQAQEQPKPKAPGPFPDMPQKNMEDWDYNDWVGAIKKSNEEVRSAYEDRITKLEGNYQQDQQQRQQNAYADRIHSHLVTAIDKAGEKLPAFKDKNPQNMEALNNAVAIAYQKAGNNPGKVSIPVIAKKTNDWIMGLSKADRQAKITAATNPKLKGPGKGTGSKPGKKGPKTWDDAHAQFAADIAAMGEAGQE